MTNCHVVDVAIGSRHGPFKFIRQHVVSDLVGDGFTFELPGRVIRCDGMNFLSILPLGRLVLTDGEIPRAATISAAVVDEAGLDITLRQLQKQATSIEGFAIRLASTQHTFSDVVDAAEKASSMSDCCEDCSGKVANIYGSLRVGIIALGDKDYRWSTPVRAAIKAWTGDDERYRPFNPKDDSTASDDDYCDSEWWCDWWYQNRTTTCHGSACKAPKICACLKDKKGRTHGACKGWSFCWCM